MKLQVLGLGCLLALAASGCSSFGTAKPHRPATYPPLDTRGAYPASRLIGIKNNPADSCPKIMGWTVRQLFQRSTRKDVCLPGELPDPGLIAVERQMDAFCLYEQGRGPRTIPQAAALGLARLEPDAVAMTAAVQIPGKSGPLGQSIGLQLENHFTQQVGGGRPSRKETPSVRLAFLDSEPENKDVTRMNQKIEHGHFLRLLGGKLVGAKVRITTQLALPIVSFKADQPENSSRDPQGGYVGSFADLAEAIQEEVTAWRQQGPEHLVLNLSVGWDGTRFGGLTETRVCDLPLGPRAVYLALEAAARQGVLIFAAAGNAQAGPNASAGPLLPAAWVRGNIKESACGDKLEGPLLYAVGGLQANDQPIANARKRGMPDLAAYADHVAVTDPEKGALTSTYTGTSVATAVVSSIAARIWSDLGGPKESIVKRLRESGQELELQADFYAYGPGKVRRIGVCTENCAEGPLIIDFDDSGSPVLQATQLPQDCDGAAIYRVGTASLNRPLCPSSTFDDRWIDAWVVPQPESDPCPSCAMGPPRSMAQNLSVAEFVLRGEISEEWLEAKEKLTAATLETVSLSGVHTYFAFDVRPDYRDHPRFEIALSGTPFGGSLPAKATVTWVVQSDDKTSSINSPVLITKF